jgi:hypothetical protein
VNWQLDKIICVYKSHLLFISQPRLDDIILGGAHVVEVVAYDYFFCQRIEFYEIVHRYFSVDRFQFFERFIFFPFLLILLLEIFFETMTVLCELFKLFRFFLEFVFNLCVVRVHA